MTTSGLMRMIISVKDMAEAVSYYKDLLEMKVVSRQEIDSSLLCTLWNLPEGTTAEAVFLKNDVQPTCLELIRFTPNSGTCIRQGARPYDFGLFDIALRTKDAALAEKLITDQGYSVQCPAVEYTADWANVTVKEAVVIGPDQVPNALIERVTNPTPIDGLFGEFTDNAQVVEDMEEAISFYQEALGLPKVFDMVRPKNLVNEIVGIPEDEAVRMVMFVKPGTPLVECLEYSIKGRSLSEIATPPNRGLFMISFETDDLVAQMDKLHHYGFPVLSGPVEIDDAINGEVTSIRVSGPSGMMIELYEKQCR